METAFFFLSQIVLPVFCDNFQIFHIWWEEYVPWNELDTRTRDHVFHKKDLKNTNTRSSSPNFLSNNNHVFTPISPHIIIALQYFLSYRPLFKLYKRANVI